MDTLCVPPRCGLMSAPRAEVDLLSREIGADKLHRISGKPIDITPVIYRLSWFRRHQPEVLDRAAKIADVHCFLTGRFTGNWMSSWTSADPFGLLDIESRAWSEEFLAHLGIRTDQLGTLVQPGTVTGTVTAEAAARTGLPEGLPLVAAGGDGQCAGLGVNAARKGVVYLNLGTALITGAWAPDPMISLNWRTMSSPTGNGYFLEGCQRAGAFLINWFVDTFAGGRDDPSVFSKLEAEAEAIPVGAEGVTVCPYLTRLYGPALGHRRACQFQWPFSKPWSWPYLQGHSGSHDARKCARHHRNERKWPENRKDRRRRRRWKQSAVDPDVCRRDGSAGSYLAKPGSILSRRCHERGLWGGMV